MLSRFPKGWAAGLSCLDEWCLNSWWKLAHLLMGYCTRVGAQRLTYRILSGLPPLSFHIELALAASQRMATLLKLGRGWMSVSRANESFWHNIPRPLKGNKWTLLEGTIFVHEWPLVNTSKEACNLAPGLTSLAWRNHSDWGVGVGIWGLGLCYHHGTKMLAGPL